jgi:hypothetical protein
MSKLPTVVTVLGVNMLLVVGSLFLFKVAVNGTPLRTTGLKKLADFV